MSVKRGGQRGERLPGVRDHDLRYGQVRQGVIDEQRRRSAAHGVRREPMPVFGPPAQRGK